MVNYGGDEVSALVLDIGASSIRVGYAGDDTPRSIIPTSYGCIEEPYVGEDVTMKDDLANESSQNGGEAPSTSKRLYIGHHGPSLFRPKMEVRNPMKDGLIDDFDPIPALIRNAFVDSLHCNPSEHPVLVTEAAWNTAANRERMAQIMFEEFQVPAFYIANTGVLNAFAAGKGTALVIDIGHSEASVTPVVDGFVLRKGLAHSSLPQFVRAHAKFILSNPSPSRMAIQLLPHQLIASKRPVPDGAQPIFSLREDRISTVTPTWRQWYEDREVDEWIMSVASVAEQGWNEQMIAQRSKRPYEFPTGYNSMFGTERFIVGEQFFAHSPSLVQSNPNIPKTLPNLIAQSLSACEPDLRAVLLANIVLSGGGSLFAGLVERLSNELARNFPHMKIHAPGNPTERRYGGWLGGSILASLGTFHQLWISKEEWEVCTGVLRPVQAPASIAPRALLSPSFIQIPYAMVDWQSTAEIEKDELAFENLIYVLFGLYVWELFQTSGVEWSLLVTRQRTFKWPMALYTFNSWTGNMAILCASTSLMIRTIAIWERKLTVVVPLLLLCLAHWGLLYHGIIIVRATWDASQSACVVNQTDSAILKFTFFATMGFDLIIFCYTCTALLRNASRSGLWHLLFRDGLIYWVVTFSVNAIPAVLNSLNLNTPMNIVATVPAATVAAIAACRCVVRLQDYRNADHFMSTSNLSQPQRSSLGFSFDGRFVARYASGAGISKPPRVARPEVHIRTDQITMDNLSIVEYEDTNVSSAITTDTLKTPRDLEEGQNGHDDMIKVNRDVAFLITD
ncbi:hypothetical protein EW145_g599 [Phellinidium pouzarii]|uniref:Uncharacterized protein n=1 Tax=Phellinidium pouzarii TaxID=167371 RepID=A0A4S4LHP9_9AGAM|nr:hypothetical protein EW145_g599 [Phellinidium pouzarii]